MVTTKDHRMVRLLGINVIVDVDRAPLSVNGFSALHRALFDGNLEDVCFMSKKLGVGLNNLTNSRLTPLILSAHKSHHHVSVWLVKEGANLLFRSSSPSSATQIPNKHRTSRQKPTAPTHFALRLDWRNAQVAEKHDTVVKPANYCTGRHTDKIASIGLRALSEAKGVKSPCTKNKAEAEVYLVELFEDTNLCAYMQKVWLFWLKTLN